MIAAYLRVSTAEQRENQTIETQHDEFQRFCEARKVPPAQVYKIYDDNGVSGTISLGRRAHGRVLLEDAKAGRFNELVIWKWDRLGRKLHQFLDAIEELRKYGVKVTAIAQPTSEDSAGWLMRSILGAFAEHERSQIVERSVAGSRRLARNGVWLGGVVPYGYRKVGDNREARLEASAEPIPGLVNWTEVKVILRIFQMAAAGDSCQKIADYLNRIGIPPAYCRNGQEVLRGKRKERTSGIWRASRIRNLIVSQTYKGVHEYGKRKVFRDENGAHFKANPIDQWITRPCLALVDEETWKRANAELKRNQIIAMAHAKNDYLLRGLVHCGLCGLTYIGTAVKRPSGKQEFYYRCNGKHGTRGLYGENGQRCPSPSLNGTALECAVWSDVETFIVKPGAMLQQLERQMCAEDGQQSRVGDEIRELEEALSRKAEVRTRVVTLFSEAVISRDEFDKQLLRIADESSDKEKQLAALRQMSAEIETKVRVLNTAESLLADLRTKVGDGELTFDSRRRIIEALVAGITVETVECQKPPNIRVKFRFEPHFERYRKGAALASCLPVHNTDRGSWRPPA